MNVRKCVRGLRTMCGIKELEIMCSFKPIVFFCGSVFEWEFSTLKNKIGCADVVDWFVLDGGKACIFIGPYSI